jgi:hypothetical protein
VNVKRTREEVAGVINKTWDSTNSGVSQYPGMSYEEGVRAGIGWLLGETDDHPFEE